MVHPGYPCQLATGIDRRTRLQRRQSRTAARHNDRRLAESIYRAAVASGIMERVAYQDTIAEAG